MPPCIPRAILCLSLINLLTGLADAAPQLAGQASAPAEPLSLWYRQPAEKWTDALAVGNGWIGAMVFGGIDRERLQLNEDTLWAGGPYDPVNPQALAALPEVRRLVFGGNYRDASKLIIQTVISRPVGQIPDQTAGDFAPSRTYPNLFDANPPFQIDGNFGGTAAIAEMLLQSQNGEIELLPALPTAWPVGSVRGLRARGGYELDITWDGGRLTLVKVKSTGGRQTTLRYGSRTTEILLKSGQVLALDSDLKPVQKS